MKEKQPGKTRQAKIQEKLEIIPDHYKNIYLAVTKGNSRKASVKAFCLECVSWKREDVRQCTGVACPNYAMRPYQK